MSSYTIRGYLIDTSSFAYDEDDTRWFMGGVWDADGRLVWSSEPEVFETEREAEYEAEQHVPTHRDLMCPADGLQRGVLLRHSDNPSDVFGECRACGRILRP